MKENASFFFSVDRIFKTDDGIVISYKVNSRPGAEQIPVGKAGVLLIVFKILYIPHIKVRFKVDREREVPELLKRHETKTQFGIKNPLFQRGAVEVKLLSLYNIEFITPDEILSIAKPLQVGIWLPVRTAKVEGGVIGEVEITGQVEKPGVVDINAEQVKVIVKA